MVGRLGFGIASLCLAAACTSFGVAPADTTDQADTTPVPKSVSTHDAGAKPDAAPTAPDAGPPAPSFAGHWNGTRDATERVQYGGGDVCGTNAMFTGISVDLVVADSKVTSASVTATLKQASNNAITIGCQADDDGTFEQAYILDQAAIDPTAGTVHITFKPSLLNDVEASLDLTGSLQNPSVFDLTWTRTDAKQQPLQWTIRSPVTAPRE